MSVAVVNKIIRSSAVDGPGNRTVIFLQGCNFNCRYCHNPETIGICLECGTCIMYCPSGAISLKDGSMSYDISRCVNCDECFHHCPHGSSPKTTKMSATEVFNEVKQNMPYIRGITISGGECTLSRDFIYEVLCLAKEEGLSTMLDSNGSYDFSKDHELLSVVDGIMLDVKTFDAMEHQTITENKNDIVLLNMEYLANHNKLFEVRTVAVPDLFQVTKTVEQTSALLKRLGKGETVRYKLIKYRPIGVREAFRHYQTPSDEYMQMLADIAAKNGTKDVVII